MSAPAISLITTCKGRLEHLRRTLPLMAAQGVSAQIVVVDFDCPDGAAAWVRDALPSVVVVQARDQPLFSAAAARNLGAAAATAPWLFFIDADVEAQGGVAAQILPRLAAGAFLIPEPRTRGLWGAVVVAAADFHRIGGYDETFQGWGGEDDDLLERLTAAGLRQDRFPSDGLACIEHDDALRTRHHAERDMALNSLINSFYIGVKADLAGLRVSLGSHERQALYGNVRRTISQVAASGQAQWMQVAYRQAWAGAGAARSSLVYEIRPQPPA
jgi:glycosyltransferase involved in cell wall biosynthesis